MDYAELMELARPKLGKDCKGCLVCNGRACGDRMPGPGAKGIGDTAIRNYEKWKEIRINMSTGFRATSVSILMRISFHFS